MTIKNSQELRMDLILFFLKRLFQIPLVDALALVSINTNLRPVPSLYGK